MTLLLVADWAGTFLEPGRLYLLPYAGSPHHDRCERLRLVRAPAAAAGCSTGLVRGLRRARPENREEEPSGPLSGRLTSGAHASG